MPICPDYPACGVGRVEVEAQMGDPVGGTTGVEYEVVASRVRALRNLVDEFLDDVHPALVNTRNRQNSTRWTDLPECAGFRGQYQASIDVADIALRAVWDDIVGLAQNLRASADSMANLDQAVGDDLTALITRLEQDRPTAYAEFTSVPTEIAYGLTGGYVPGSGTAPAMATDASVTADDGTA